MLSVWVRLPPGALTGLACALLLALTPACLRGLPRADVPPGAEGVLAIVDVDGRPSAPPRRNALVTIDLETGEQKRARASAIFPWAQILDGRVLVQRRVRNWEWAIESRPASRPDAEPSIIGAATSNLASPHGRTLWLFRYDGRDLVDVREIDLRGRELTHAQAAGRTRVLAVTGRGLAVSRNPPGDSVEAGPSGLELWAPERGTYETLDERADTKLVAAGDRAVAWTHTDECTKAGCRIHVADAAGEPRVLGPWPGWTRIHGGPFSPDERTLAVLVQRGRGRPAIGLVDLGTGRAEIVKGSAGVTSSVVWSSDGKWFFFGTRPNEYRLATELRAYRPGARAAVVVRGVGARAFGSLAAG